METLGWASPLVQRLPKAAEKHQQLLLLQTINSGRVSAVKTELGGGGGGGGEFAAATSPMKERLVLTQRRLQLRPPPQGRASMAGCCSVPLLL